MRRLFKHLCCGHIFHWSILYLNLKVFRLQTFPIQWSDLMNAIYCLRLSFPISCCCIAPQFLFQIFIQSFSCFKSHPRIFQLLSFCRECVSCPTSLKMWKPQMLHCSDNTSFAFNAGCKSLWILLSFLLSSSSAGPKSISYPKPMPAWGRWGPFHPFLYKQPSWRPWSFPARALDLNAASLYDRCV